MDESLFMGENGGVIKNNNIVRGRSRGDEMGEFSPPFSKPPSFVFLISQIFK